MKYRVRIDESFEKEEDAQALMDFARQLLSKAVNINEGKSNEEKTFCDVHLCGHDEGKPCINHEREEVMDSKVVTVLSVL